MLISWKRHLPSINLKTCLIVIISEPRLYSGKPSFAIRWPFNCTWNGVMLCVGGSLALICQLSILAWNIFIWSLEYPSPKLESEFKCQKQKKRVSKKMSDEFDLVRVSREITADWLTNQNSVDLLHQASPWKPSKKIPISIWATWVTWMAILILET